MLDNLIVTYQTGRDKSSLTELCNLETAFDALYEIGTHLAVGNPLDEALAVFVKLAISAVSCDSCFIYVREKAELAPWVWRNSEPEAMEHSNRHLRNGAEKLLAERRTPLALQDGTQSPSFKPFGEWSQNPGETFVMIPLLSRKELVGAINLQHHEPKAYSAEAMRLLSTAALLIGAEIGMGRLRDKNSDLILQLETRKLVERGKGILQRDLGLNEEQSYLALQQQSREKRRSLKEIAEALVMSDEIRRGAVTI